MKLHLNRRPVVTGEEEAADAFDAAEVAGAAFAESPADEPVPATPTVSPLRPLNAVMPQGNPRMVQTAELAEVEALGEQQALAPFRTLQAFSYSVNLLFHRTDLSYYITLCHEGRLWRALHANEFDSAEAAFRHFEEQAIRFSDIELRRAQLEAQNLHVATLIEASEAQAERLRNDLEQHAAQSQLVSSRQQHVRREVAQLEAQRVAAQAQLNKSTRQIHQLRATSNERIPHLTTRKNDV
ncbi:DUF2968 domain-containing protein [Burkholderia sp. BCC1988]|uniref:DUF2968 domain-containing protein n=1 Tax=Burkholderia sp. BCC1988 TaxID=2817443 RepID=UPI002AB135BB|nr:DUF2968 domain-containing protein [Burkholderia sp. BCC1988]